jgi:hypothetical protein
VSIRAIPNKYNRLPYILSRKSHEKIILSVHLREEGQRRGDGWNRLEMRSSDG